MAKLKDLPSYQMFFYLPNPVCSVFSLLFIVLLLLSGHWCTQCLPSCQSLTSSAWHSLLRRTPTFMTFMLAKDKACISLQKHTHTSLKTRLLYSCTVRIQRNTIYCVCSYGPPWSSGALVKMEISDHPHHGHPADVCLCRSRHRKHQALVKPAQHLSGQDKQPSMLTVPCQLLFGCFLQRCLHSHFFL